MYIRVQTNLFSSTFFEVFFSLVGWLVFCVCFVVVGCFFFLYGTLMAPYTFEAKYFPFTFSNFSLTGLGFVAVTASAISWPILKDCSFVAPFKSTNMLQEIRHRKSTQFLKIISYSFLVERQGCCSQMYSLPLARKAKNLRNFGVQHEMRSAKGLMNAVTIWWGRERDHSQALQNLEFPGQNCKELWYAIFPLLWEAAGFYFLPPTIFF